MSYSSLNKTTGPLYFFFIIYIKMGGTTYYRKNREVMLNTANKYYENNK